LVLWREPRELLWPLLAWINTQLVVEQRTAALEGGATGPLPHLYRHHNQAGIAVAWAMRYLGAQPERASSEPERMHMLELAGRHWEVLNLLAEVRQGVRGFEATGTRITLPFTGDHDLVALDRMLGIVDVVMSVPDPDSVDEPLVGAWLRSKQVPTPWPAAPMGLRAASREMAQRTVSGYPRPLPGDVDLGGFNLDDVALVWMELLGPALYAGRIDEGQYRCVDRGADRAGRRARNGRGFRDGPREGLGPQGGGSADLRPGPRAGPLPHSLDPRRPWIGGAPERPHPPGIDLPQRRGIGPAATCGIRRAQASSGRDRAEAVAASLRERLSGAHVAKGVRLRRDDGTPAGDLDVVAFDASQRILVAIEVLWRIAPDGAAQGFAHEEAAHDKRMQVARVRAALADGSAQPLWPWDGQTSPAQSGAGTS
jgi:hypothetical protein